MILALVIGHQPLLRLLAGVLIAEEPDNGATWLVLLDRNLDPECAAKYIRAEEGAQVLLIGWVPERTEALGVLPLRAERERQFLVSRDVPVSAIHVWPEQTRDDWDRARALGAWLREHPEVQVAVLCDRFGSRRLRIILDRSLGADASRAHVTAVPDRRYDETNWWRRQEGTVHTWYGFTSLSYVCLVGEGDAPTPNWDLDAYERALP
jgi:hypothetical protein